MASDAARVKRVGRHGDVVIPAHLRRRLGLTEGSAVVAEERDGGVLIRPARRTPEEEERWRDRVFAEANAAWAAQRADPEALRQLQQEDALWEATLMDGLDPDDVWDTPPAAEA